MRHSEDYDVDLQNQRYQQIMDELDEDKITTARKTFATYLLVVAIVSAIILLIKVIV